MSLAHDDELRAIVRASIARVMGTPGPIGADTPGHVRLTVTPAGHASHYRYVLPESDGPCLIEPTVQCNHCGYCQSHGH